MKKVRRDDTTPKSERVIIGVVKSLTTVQGSVLLHCEEDDTKRAYAIPLRLVGSEDKISTFQVDGKKVGLDRIYDLMFGNRLRVEYYPDRKLVKDGPKAVFSTETT